MTTALSTISALPNGKDELYSFIRMLKSEILAADRDPLPILVHLKYIEKVITEVLKDDEIDSHFLREFQTYSSKEKVVINGAELKQMETGVKYDYNASGDVVWMDLDKQVTELTEKRKAREKLLQNLDEKGLVDPENGNYLNRPPKSSKTKVSVTIK